MNRGFLFPALLGLLLVAPAMAEGVYKWVDDNGQVHYSDMPQEGATEIELRPPQTFRSSSAARKSAAATDSEADADGDGDEQDQGYESLAITSPNVEETIWNTGGEVNVSLSLQPGLKAGHRIRLFMDGQLLADLPPRASSMKLSEVYRGEHILEAEVRDEKGETQIKSDPVTFFYQQTAVNRRPGGNTGF
jgi:hypothetical protein